MTSKKQPQGGAPVNENAFSYGEHNSNFTMVFVGDISIVFICIYGLISPTYI